MVTFTYFNDVLGCDPLTSGILGDPNQVIPYFVEQVIKLPGFLGIYYSCLFSGSISSMSTAYNSVSAMLWEDWLRSWLEPKMTKRQIMITVKVIATAIGVVCTAVAISANYVGGTAIRITIMFTGLFAGGIHAVYFAGAFLRFTNSLVLMSIFPHSMSFNIFFT